MTFTVVWERASENQHAQLWVNAPDRNAVTAASHEIDRRLRNDPQDQGESRTPETRILIVPPLAALFEAIEPDRLVKVLTVWHV